MREAATLATVRSHAVIRITNPLITRKSSGPSDPYTSHRPTFGKTSAGD